MKNAIHMSKFENTLFSGAEWPLTTHHWTILQLKEGIAYVCSRGLNSEIQTGAMVVCPPDSKVVILASTLGQARFQGITVQLSSLSGFLTQMERQSLETLVPRSCGPFLLLAGTHALGARLAEVCREDNSVRCLGRMAFFHGFLELLAPYLSKAIAQEETGQQDARARLRQFINQAPESELTNLTLGKLAEHLHCCERHTSRIFHEVCGSSFRQYISEIRLKKACQILLQGQHKIIDVALESGHGSLALFNYLFKRRFGMTPTAWREKHISRDRRPVRSGNRISASRSAMQTALWLLGPITGVLRFAAESLVG
ncbi:MAG: helix-turn-helix transcriptional regulator [Akkermansiaceae bacterium]|nr:helix-turn-helix transcriptional regulator [Verrucomicrobiales bacterium]